MKAPLASILFVAACSVSGCSSSPLLGVPETATDSASAGAGPSSVAAGGGPAATWAAYPPGPYGTARGATIQDLSFLGWKQPNLAGYDLSQVETVRLSDFYDPDGTKGVKLLAINASAVWCGVCKAEYQDMKDTKVYQNLHAQGLEILGTLFQDVNYYPAQPVDLKNWGAVANHAVTFPLVLDPGFKMGAYFDSDATPLNLLIDARTMTIVSVTMGYLPAQTVGSMSPYWLDVQAKLSKL
jgi:AhpC/TSA family